MNFFNQQRALGRGRKLKLTEQSVRQIRQMIRDGIPQTKIAAEIGVAKSTISNVATKQIWGHVAEDAE